MDAGSANGGLPRLQLHRGRVSRNRWRIAQTIAPGQDSTRCLPELPACQTPEGPARHVTAAPWSRWPGWAPPVRLQCRLDRAAGFDWTAAVSPSCRRGSVGSGPPVGSRQLHRRRRASCCCQGPRAHAALQHEHPPPPSELETNECMVRHSWSPSGQRPSTATSGRRRDQVKYRRPLLEMMVLFLTDSSHTPHSESIFLNSPTRPSLPTHQSLHYLQHQQQAPFHPSKWLTTARSTRPL